MKSYISCWLCKRGGEGSLRQKHDLILSFSPFTANIIEVWCKSTQLYLCCTQRTYFTIYCMWCFFQGFMSRLCIQILYGCILYYLRAVPFSGTNNLTWCKENVFQKLFWINFLMRNKVQSCTETSYFICFILVQHKNYWSYQVNNLKTSLNFVFMYNIKYKLILLSKVRRDCLLKVYKICKYKIICKYGSDYYFLPHSPTMTFKFVHLIYFYQ